MKSIKTRVGTVAAVMTATLVASLACTLPASADTDPPAASVASVEQVIASQPSGSELPNNDRAALATQLFDFAQFIKAHPELMQLAQSGGVNPAGSVIPDFSVGFGWYIYFHHLTPDDQRYFMDIGATGVATVICAASGLDPAVCLYAGAIAAILVLTIDHYYDPPWCLEIQINYTISLHDAYRTQC